jgi:integrase
MAREKGTGNLQREKSGRWTVRVGIGGKRYSRSARTRDRAKAEAFLNRMLAPFGLGDKTIPLAEVWREYEKSPNRKEQTESTMNSKRVVWMRFAAWIEDNHIEITQLKQLSAEAVSEYLRVFRLGHTASTYNNHVCVLREICRTVADKAGVVEDPWAGVQLLPDDSHTRREFTVDELKRIMDAATRQGAEWRLLFALGMYTGLRLGDCCRLEWASVNLERKVIQVIPSKTKKYAHGRPVTIPIHPSLLAELVEGRGKREEGKEGIREEEEICVIAALSSLPSSPLPLPSSPYVLPQIADQYRSCHWKIDHALKAILEEAGIAASVKIEGRRSATPDATFHSLRHTFVSFSANAGVPLPVVASIVGHTSTAMTRHYYHENEDALRRAVEAVPSLEEIGKREEGRGKRGDGVLDTSFTEFTESGKRERSLKRPRSVELRLKQLANLIAKGLITQDEHDTQRERILNEL